SPPPPSPPFPYTTLFRSNVMRFHAAPGAAQKRPRPRPRFARGGELSGPSRRRVRTYRLQDITPGRRRNVTGDWGRNFAQKTERRSEEHTSELQSLAYLVC